MFNSRQSTVAPERVLPPSADQRWQVVDATMRRHGYAPSALIEALRSVQESFGHIDEPALLYVAHSLRVRESDAYGTATFYDLFRFAPMGKHCCTICTGTACHVRGSSRLLAAVAEATGTSPGETNASTGITLGTSQCLGMCAESPAAILDGEFAGDLTPEAIRSRVKRWTDE